MTIPIVSEEEALFNDFENGVYVCQLNHMTNIEWAEAFKGILND